MKIKKQILAVGSILAIAVVIFGFREWADAPEPENSSAAPTVTVTAPTPQATATEPMATEPTTEPTAAEPTTEPTEDEPTAKPSDRADVDAEPVSDPASSREPGNSGVQETNASTESTDAIEDSLERQLNASSAIQTQVICPSTFVAKQGVEFRCRVYDRARLDDGVLNLAQVRIEGNGRFTWHSVG